MPHTSRKKRNTPVKRIEVTDDDGWTRVTTTGRSQRAPRTIAHAPVMSCQSLWKTVPEPGSSVEKVRAAYLKHEQHWLASDSCKALATVLKEQVLADDFHVDKCIIFGSASFCGVWQGWKERHAAALIQLAVLKTLQSTIGTITQKSPPMYAQDPAYNEIDVEFLRTLGVTVIQDLEGYNLITENSVTYTPGAEMFVEMQVLQQQPGVLLTGKLDWYWRNEKGQACTNRVSLGDDMLTTMNESANSGSISGRDKRDDTSTNQKLERGCQIFETFLGGKQYVSLPQFDYKDDPFHNQYLYWRAREDTDVMGPDSTVK